MAINIRGEVAENVRPNIIKSLHKFTSKEDLVERINNLLDGQVGNIINIGCSGYNLGEYILSSRMEIHEILRGLPAEHVVINELLKQANETLLEILNMKPDNPLLHYYDEPDSRISNSIHVPILSESLFETFLKVCYHLIENPVLKNTQPPKEEIIMWDISGLGTFSKKHPHEVRQFVEKIEELKLGSHLPITLLGELGDISAIDKLINLYVHAKGQKKFEYVGWGKEIYWKSFISYNIKERIERNSNYKMEEIEAYALRTISQVKNVKLKGNLEKLFTTK